MLSADPLDPPLIPGSTAWQASMSASKIAAVVGLSPYQSHFSLYHTMAGNLPPSGDPTPSQRRGHLLEEAVARYVAEEHRLTLQPGGSWRNRERPWQTASPDRLAVDDRFEPCAVVEAKTAADWEPWGADGTDEVPAHYRAQVLWQLDALGLEVGYLGVLLPYLTFRSYVIRPQPGECEWLRDQARAFLDAVEAGVEPDVDTHGSTYPTIRQLHPDIEPRTVDVDPKTADRYVAAVLALRAAKREEAAAKTLIAHAMGTARQAVHAATGTLVARREAKNGGVPYVRAPDDLAPPTEETT